MPIEKLNRKKFINWLREYSIVDKINEVIEYVLGLREEIDSLSDELILTQTTMLYSRTGLNISNSAGTQGAPTVKLTIPIPAGAFTNIGSIVKGRIAGTITADTGARIIVQVNPEEDLGNYNTVADTGFSTISDTQFFMVDFQIQRTNQDQYETIQELVYSSTTLVTGQSKVDNEVYIGDNDYTNEGKDVVGGIINIEILLGSTLINHVNLNQVQVRLEKISE